MNIKFASQGGKGSCATLVNYLEKEDSLREKKGLMAECFFSQDSDRVPASEVKMQIDRNIRKLGQQDSKYFTFAVSPSKEELNHIGSDSAKLKAYTRGLMEQYAQGFGKGLTSQDLVWYAKVEHNRYDRQTKQEKGEGNMHIHVIVSRRDKEQKYKLSPLSNARGAYQTSNKIQSGGFDRKAFMQAAERLYDASFGFVRSPDQSFEYLQVMRTGNEVQKEQQLERLLKSLPKLAPLKPPVAKVELVPKKEAPIQEKTQVKPVPKPVSQPMPKPELIQKPLSVEPLKPKEPTIEGPMEKDPQKEEKQAAKKPIKPQIRRKGPGL